MMFRFAQVLFLLATVMVCTNIAADEEAASLNKTWEANARKSGLSVKEVSLLEKNRILITNEAYKQIFSVYVNSDEPVFITSDSLLNAYHVLYEESILRLERTMSGRLPDILKIILRNIEDVDEHFQGKPALVSAAKMRAMLVTGIAMKLMDDSFQFRDERLNEILDQEVQRIEAAEGVKMPKWLGRPDLFFTAIDYSRYKPRGFYTRSERLKRYFRAVSWLQSIPFRVKNDEELLAILMLGNCIAHNNYNHISEAKEIDLFFGVYSSFIGSGDDWDLRTAANEAWKKRRIDLNEDELQGIRARLRTKAEGRGKRPLINDRIRYLSNGPKKIAELNFRIISAHRTPSAILFQRTTDIREFGGRFPDGLEVSISLGSTFARKSLRDYRKERLIRTIDSYQTYFRGSSLYLEYLDALKSLLDAPEADAPDFMKNEAWQIKSCNTVLAGWAQLRHTWALQAKQTLLVQSMVGIPKGFVEPEPEFFYRMANLSDKTKQLLKQSGVFDTDYAHIILDIQRFKSVIEGVKNVDMLREKFSQLSREDLNSMNLPCALMEMHESNEEEWSEAFVKEKIQWLDTLATDIKQGRQDKHPGLEAVIKEYDFDIEELWECFGTTCRRLESIAHKQLRGVDLNTDENTFVRNYGGTIAKIMFYGSNSYLSPMDDAVRLVDVYFNPLKEGGSLHVGVARPRTLYVLYPWKGKAILCKGAVMPYYEFVTATRLNDESWKEMLDSEKRPSLPKWIAPIVSGKNLGNPKFADY